MKAQEIPEAIQWHEGMLLTPQHFQQMQARFGALIQYQAMAMSPFHWGIRQIKIDQTRLVSGVLRILDLEAVLPDCLVVSHVSSVDEDLELDLTPFTEDLRMREMTIHLGVATNQVDPNKGTMTRYRSVEGELVADENSGDGFLRIPRLRPLLTLLATEIPPPKYVSFPLAKVTLQNEAFVLTDYMPPVLQVSLKSPLGTLCAGVAHRLREKAMYLAEQARSPAANTQATEILGLKAQIQSLVEPLPYLEAVLATGASHPYIVFLALCSVVGQVSTLSSRLLPPVLPAYDHNNLRFTFEQATTYVTRMLNEAVTEAYKTYVFTFEDGYYNLFFDPAWSDRRLVIGMRPHISMSEKELLAWGEGCVIGSKNKLELLRTNRILGAGRRRIEREGDLVPTRGQILFALNPDKEFIQPNEVLQIFNSGDSRPAEIVLYVVQKTGGPLLTRAVLK